MTYKGYDIKIYNRTMKWQRENKEKYNNYHKQWQAKNLDKYKATKRRYFIRKHKDKLIKMLELGLNYQKVSYNMMKNAERKAQRWVSLKSCVVCSNLGEERHHNDYSKPLEINSLCKKCHNLLHKRFKFLTEEDISYLKSLSEPLLKPILE